MTSAPRAPSLCAANGPAIGIEQSITRTPSSMPRCVGVPSVIAVHFVRCFGGASRLWSDGPDGFPGARGRGRAAEQSDGRVVAAPLAVLEPDHRAVVTGGLVAAD